MKSFFKRSAISLIVLGVTGSAYAATPHHTYQPSTWSPQYSGFFLGVEGLYLEPRNGDLDYVTIFPTTTGGGFSTQNIDTDYDWGWRIYGGIKFTENDDITLSWMQLRAGDSDSVTPTVPVNGATPNAAVRFLPTLGGHPWNNVTGHSHFDLDEAYAVWGHTIYFNNPWSVRFAAGIDWARIESDLKVTATDAGTTAGGNFGTIGYESKSHLKGIGPRVEFDMTYHLGYGFALYGKANAALL